MTLPRFAVLLVFALGAGLLWVQWSSTGSSTPASEVSAEPASQGLGGARPTERVSLAGRHPKEPAAIDVDQGAGESSRRNAERNREAIAALDAGELDRAVRLFEECVATDPEQPVFARNLAEALARRAFQTRGAGDSEVRAEALADLERAVALDSSREDLARLLERWRKSDEAEADFWRKTTEHFELSFDGTRDELMWGTAPLENELEAAYHEFGELFGIFPVEEGRPRFRVVLYRPEAFGSVTGLDDWAAGAFDGTVRVPVQNLGSQVEQLKSVLRHELVHAFVHEVGGPRVPGWLNEGLAQLEEPPFRNERLPLERRAKERLRGRTLFALDELTGSLASWSDREKIQTAYAQSLAFVAYLQRQHGERVVIEMIEGCGRGISPAATFRTRIGVELDVMLEDLARGL